MKDHWQSYYPLRNGWTIPQEFSVAKKMQKVIMLYCWSDMTRTVGSLKTSGGQPGAKRAILESTETEQTIKIV